MPANKKEQKSPFYLFLGGRVWGKGGDHMNPRLVFLIPDIYSVVNYQRHFGMTLPVMEYVLQRPARIRFKTHDLGVKLRRGNQFKLRIE